MKTIELRRTFWFMAIFLLLAALLAACGGGEPVEGEVPGMETPAIPIEPAPGEVEETPELPETGTTPMATDEATPVETPTSEATLEATQPTETEGQPSGDMANTLRVAVVRGAMIETMRTLADQYMQQNEGVEITVEEEPEGGAFEALIAAGNQPDLIVASFGSQIGRLAASEAVIPLGDMPGSQELFGRLDEATVQELYGGLYYVPIGADVTMMIYNKELFEEAGLDPEAPPTTWDEFLTAAEAINNLESRGGTNIYGAVFWNEALTWGGWYWNMLQPMYVNVNQGQCQLLNRLGTDIVFDQPDCGMADFFEFNRNAQQFAPATMEQSFFSRTIGMWPQYGYSWEPNLREAANQPMVIGEDVGIAPVPVPNEGDTAYTTYGGRGLMILRTTPDRQNRAWDFIQFLMEDENNMLFLEELGYLPTLTSLKDHEYFQDPARQPFVEALENAILPEQVAVAEDVANEILAVYQQAAVEGSIEPEQAVEQAAQNARNVIRE
jgi:multiple sugar transport system substrate-binding protein